MVAEIKSQKEFTDLIGEDKVAVVDFHATWCGPCKQIAPFVEKLSKDFSDANFVKVDVDEVTDVAAEFGVRAMPTFMIFRKGEKLAEVVGANPAALKAAVQAAVAAWLAGEPVTPFEKAPPNAALDFVNNYGRFIVILIGLLIWYFKKDPAGSGSKAGQSEDFPIGF